MPKKSLKSVTKIKRKPIRLVRTTIWEFPTKTAFKKGLRQLFLDDNLVAKFMKTRTRTFCNICKNSKTEMTVTYNLEHYWD